MADNPPMYQATISSSIPILAYIGISLMGAGAVGLVIFITLSLKDHERNKRVYRLMSIVFAMILITGLPIYIVQGISGSNAEISMGTGFVHVSGPYIGNQNFTSSQVRYAFMENINTGNVTITIRDAGTSLGNLNEGLFTLSNGKTAYVATDNATSLVVSLDSGKFLILGSQDSLPLAEYFSSHVKNVRGL
jgi:hypothetical protein